MQETTTLLARTLAMLELDALTNGGRIRISDCVQPLVGYFDFQKFPTKPEDFDLDKGVTFESGKAGEFLVQSLTIYGGAISLDTLATTDESTRILLEMLQWGKESLGLSFRPSMIRRFGYISHLAFRSDIPLLKLHSSPAQKLAEKITSVTDETFGGLTYQPHQLWIGHDPLVRKHSIASFVLVHRGNTRFDENVFWSEAPLQTKQHIQFVKEFEDDVRASMK